MVTCFQVSSALFAADLFHVMPKDTGAVSDVVTVILRCASPLIPIPSPRRERLRDSSRGRLRPRKWTRTERGTSKWSYGPQAGSEHAKALAGHSLAVDAACAELVAVRAVRHRPVPEGDVAPQRVAEVDGRRRFHGRPHPRQGG